MKITYFVHSITKDNESCIATGWLDSSLSAEGIRRAEDLHERIKHRTFDAIYTSDLKRAIESADIFFGKHIPKNVDQRLRECNYGSFDGTPALDFKKGREQEYINMPYPDGESYLDVEGRIKDFLNDAQQNAISDYKYIMNSIIDFFLDTATNITFNPMKLLKMAKNHYDDYNTLVL